jgi:hypothetical protein
MIGATVFRQFDNRILLGFDVWEFCFRSLFCRYGRFFLGRIVFRHPWRSIRGLWHYCRIIRRQRQPDYAVISFDNDSELLAHRIRPTLVGIGFCQKPIDPPCPSGRFNHDCRCLDNPGLGEMRACRCCEVRTIAHQAGGSGAAVYLLTSAEHIALDLLIPALQHKIRGPVVLLVCPYSIAPLGLAMSICGLSGVLLAYHRGDCRDYAAWIKADVGVKTEQTFLAPCAASTLTGIFELPNKASEKRGAHRAFRREGNVYFSLGQ